MANDRERMEIVADFIFLGSKTTVDSYCSHEIKRCLLLGRKAMTNLKVKVNIAQSCPTLCEAMDHTIHGILWARSLSLLQGIFPTQGLNPDNIKKLSITLPTKVHIVKAMVFPVDLYGCESWTIKKAEHQRIDALELWCWRRLLRVPWTEEIKPVSPQRNKPWILIGRTDAEAEAPILWPPDVKSWLIGKDPDAGKDWGQEKKGDRGRFV